MGGGGTCERELNKQVESLSLEKKVHFLGFREDLEAIYPQMDTADSTGPQDRAKVHSPINQIDSF